MEWIYSLELSSNALYGRFFNQSSRTHSLTNRYNPFAGFRFSYFVVHNLLCCVNSPNQTYKFETRISFKKQTLNWNGFTTRLFERFPVWLFRVLNSVLPINERMPNNILECVYRPGPRFPLHPIRGPNRFIGFLLDDASEFLRI